jgi:hypothetical protein
MRAKSLGGNTVCDESLFRMSQVQIWRLECKNGAYSAVFLTSIFIDGFLSHYFAGVAAFTSSVAAAFLLAAGLAACLASFADAGAAPLASAATAAVLALEAAGAGFATLAEALAAAGVAATAGVAGLAAVVPVWANAVPIAKVVATRVAISLFMWCPVLSEFVGRR